MKVNYAPIIKELAENKNKTGSFQQVGPDSLAGKGGLWSIISNDFKERDKVQIDDEVYFATHSSGMDKKVKIESNPKKYEVDNNFLKKSLSYRAQGYRNRVKFSPENNFGVDSNLVGGNAIINAFGVMGFAEQVANLLDTSQYYGNLEFSKTMDINYVLKSMIESNLPSNSSLDLEDEYVKQIFEKSNVEKLVLMLEIYFKELNDNPSRSKVVNIQLILALCQKNSGVCNIDDFVDLKTTRYGLGSESMKKIIKVVEASGQQQGGDGGGGQGESGGGESSGGGGW